METSQGSMPLPLNTTAESQHLVTNDVVIMHSGKVVLCHSYKIFLQLSSLNRIEEKYLLINP
jgi:hypothetical protein